MQACAYAKTCRDGSSAITPAHILHSAVRQERRRYTDGLEHRLELTILRDGGKAVALARCGPNVAARWVSLDASLPQFKAFRQTLLDQLRGNAPLKKLDAEQIEKFGRDLFDLIVADNLRDLYSQLKPDDYVSWKILTDNDDLGDIPWEFLQEPRTLSPRRTRCVVRVLQTVGLAPPEPLPRSGITRALLVSAEPVGLRNVGWQTIESRLRREYSSRLPLALDIMEGADSVSLLQALASKPYDLVHFSCHGDATGKDGRLVLVNSKTKQPDYVKARDIASALAGRGIRLVVLSACETSSQGSQTTSFSNIAETLIRLGIPAVIANQASIAVPSMAVFVGALYRELAQSGNIDKAMAEARLALSIELKGSPEWGVPTLHRLYGGAQLYI